MNLCSKSYTKLLPENKTKIINNANFMVQIILLLILNWSILQSNVSQVKLSIPLSFKCVSELSTFIDQNETYFSRYQVINSPKFTQFQTHPHEHVFHGLAYKKDVIKKQWTNEPFIIKRTVAKTYNRWKTQQIAKVIPSWID